MAAQVYATKNSPMTTTSCPKILCHGRNCGNNTVRECKSYAHKRTHAHTQRVPTQITRVLSAGSTLVQATGQGCISPKRRFVATNIEEEQHLHKSVHVRDVSETIRESTQVFSGTPPTKNTLQARHAVPSLSHLGTSRRSPRRASGTSCVCRGGRCR